MKDKIRVEVLREEIVASLSVFSSFCKTTTFKLHTNDAVLYKDGDGKLVAHFGIILEAVNSEGAIKKLYDRRYKVGNGSLTTVQLHAYRELLDLMVGTFAMTAEKANKSLLEAVSRTDSKMELNEETADSILQEVGTSLEELPEYKPQAPL